MVHEMKKCLAGWMFHKWRQVDHYSERTAQTLMEGFETDAALMAKFSVSERRRREELYLECSEIIVLNFLCNVFV